ncbi:hypothetical protein PF003_g9100 [Phytophthora fragariae]|nr:hypothetical protein PF003_g9100 [Phytophthora fragariae]
MRLGKTTLKPSPTLHAASRSLSVRCSMRLENRPAALVQTAHASHHLLVVLLGVRLPAPWKKLPVVKAK